MATAVAWSDILDLVRCWLHPKLPNKVPDQIQETTRSVAKRMLDDLAAAAADHPGILHRLKEDASIAEMDVDISLDPEFEQFSLTDLNHYPSIQGEHRHAEDLADVWLQKDVAWAITTLKWLEAEAAIAGLHSSIMASYVCDIIADRVSDPLLWTDNVVAAGLNPRQVQPFLHRAIVDGADASLYALRKCLSTDRYSGIAFCVCITVENLPKDVSEAAVEQAHKFADYVKACGIAGRIPEATMSRLLMSQDDRVVLAAVVGEWNSEPKANIRAAVTGQWRTALLKLTTDDFRLGEILANDRELARDWIAARSRDRDATIYFRSWKTIARSITVIDIETRLQLLEEITCSPGKENIVKGLVSDDLEVYQKLLRMEQLAQYHLAPLEAHDDDGRWLADRCWIDKAALALDVGYQAKDVLLATLPKARSFWGEESAFWAGWAGEFERLAGHPDARIAKVGELGAALMQERVDRCLDRERRERMYPW